MIIQPVDVIDTVMGISKDDLDKYLPKWEEIPEDFRKGYGEAQKWVKIANDLLYAGVGLTEVVAKEGIDKDVALRHVMGVLEIYIPGNDNEPTSVHKMVGAAYLLSLWFDKIEYEVGKIHP